MLSNAYFLAKFRFDTAENEPAKNLQNFANFPNFARIPKKKAPGGQRERERRHAEAAGGEELRGGRRAGAQLRVRRRPQDGLA